MRIFLYVHTRFLGIFYTWWRSPTSLISFNHKFLCLSSYKKTKKTIKLTHPVKLYSWCVWYISGWHIYLYVYLYLYVCIYIYIYIYIYKYISCIYQLKLLKIDIVTNTYSYTSTKDYLLSCNAKIFTQSKLTVSQLSLSYK